MRAAALVLLVGLFLLAGYGEAAPRARCEYGRVQGFITIQSDPPYLVGTIPGSFTDKRLFFARRYNCKRLSAFVRRVDLGVYDVRFPGLSGRTALVSAVSQEGVSVSVQPFWGGIYRVALRGPLFDNNVLLRRDVAFSLAIF